MKKSDPLRLVQQNVKDCCNIVGKDQCVYGFQCKLFLENPVGCRWFETAVMSPDLIPTYQQLLKG